MAHRARFRFPVLLGFLAIAAFLTVPSVASAVNVSGPTITDGVCMQTLYGSPTTNANLLNCTAQDIKIAKAISATCIGTGCADSTHCKIGQTFDLLATFQVNVTANERYDAGFYFDIGGDPESDGAYTGTCSLSILDPDLDPGLELDGDSCGDLNTGTYTNVTFLIEGVECADDNNDQKLDLPNCVSWHSNSRTSCLTNTDAIPETKSKCSCDKDFQIEGITPVLPTGSVTKKATQAVVTYEIKVHNGGSGDATLSDLDDSIYKDITTKDHDGITSTDCSTTSITIAGGGDYTCHFTVLVEWPGSSNAVHDTVTARLTNSDGFLDVMGSATVVVDLNAPAP